MLVRLFYLAGCAGIGNGGKQRTAYRQTWRTGFFNNKISTLHLDGRPRNDPHLSAGSVKYHNKHIIHIIFAASLSKFMDEPFRLVFIYRGGVQMKTLITVRGRPHKDWLKPYTT